MGNIPEEIKNKIEMFYKDSYESEFTITAAKVGYSLAQKELEEKDKEIEKYKSASETNYQQVLELGTIAQDKDAEIVRLKGLLKHEVTGHTQSLRHIDNLWNDYKLENNL